MHSASSLGHAIHLESLFLPIAVWGKLMSSLLNNAAGGMPCSQVTPVFMLNVWGIERWPFCNWKVQLLKNNLKDPACLCCGNRWFLTAKWALKLLLQIKSTEQCEAQFWQQHVSFCEFAGLSFRWKLQNSIVWAVIWTGLNNLGGEQG